MYRLLLVIMVANSHAISGIELPTDYCSEMYSSTVRTLKQEKLSSADQEKAYSDAYSVLSFSLEKCNNHAGINRLLAETLVMLGNNQAASPYAQKTIDLEPKEWKANHTMGQILKNMGKYDEGLKFMSNSAYLAPEKCKTNVYLNICSTLEYIGKYKEAVDACSTSIKFNKKNGAAYQLRASALTSLGNLEESNHDHELAKKYGLRGINCHTIEISD